MAPATLRDVAALAGVSTATVSRVLNGSDRVDPGRRRAVEAAAKQLNYVTNVSARALRSRQSMTWALLVDDLQSAFFSGLADSLTQRALEHGRTLLIATTQKDVQRERQVVAAMAARQVDGLFVVSASGDATTARRVGSSDLPTVFVERYPTAMDGDVVTFDYYGAGRQQIDRLWQAGHRRIAFIGGNVLEDPGSRRIAAYRDGLRDHGVEPDEALIAVDTFWHTSGPALARMLALPDPPTALVVTVIPMLVGVLRHLVSVGISLDVCCYEDIDVPELVPVPLTVIHGDLHELARRAADTMVRRLSHPDEPFTTTVLDTVVSEHRPTTSLPQPADHPQPANH
ncbi:LacI family DNA-binding transcriptional regulator [Aestuariimicrobium soli]|uniref:LacI family DNA-binding transcriptional regulator n=1 Tax=Aestuariimicrobium soli TaxID=2035834 RepID=UPI003EB768CC